MKSYTLLFYVNLYSLLNSAMRKFLNKIRTKHQTLTPHFSQKYALLPSNNSPFTNWSRESCSVAFFTVTFSEKNTSSCSYLQKNASTNTCQMIRLLNIHNLCTKSDQDLLASISANYARQLKMTNKANQNNTEITNAATFQIYETKYSTCKNSPSICIIP